MKKTWLSVLLAVCLLFSWGLAQAAEQVPAGSTAAPSATTEKVPAATADKPAFAIEDRPTYFLIYDQSGAMNSSIYRSWRQMVKTVYHFPTYKIIEDADQVRQNVRASLSGRPDQQELARIAGEVKAEVLVIVVVHSMYERIESGYIGGGWWDDDGPESYVRTVADADLYAYNAEGQKFAKKNVREYNVKDLGTQEHPEDTIKWALAKMLTRMEGKPEI
ncbi:MAG: hypothetical protein LKF34_04705 [Acidaminococcaceae bacterium]|jgi:hypothetical protein|nr:hypothetical protein [Acidaminococcaceae bacterium]